MKAKMEHLIVYGTLQPGYANAHLLEDIEGSWSRGYVKGHLHPTGWGYTQGYPAIKLDEHGEKIPAHCLSSADLHLHWDRLDSFEGSEYRRTETSFYADNGDVIFGYIYQLNPG